MNNHIEASAQHTPGPWRQTGVNVRASDALICWSTNHHANAETPEPEKLANARLIASAPELLAALNGILSIRPDYHAGRDDLWLNRGEVERIARVAIARAKGEVET
jgi:hypothetical protein